MYYEFKHDDEEFSGEVECVKCGRITKYEDMVLSLANMKIIFGYRCHNCDHGGVDIFQLVMPERE